MKLVILIVCFVVFMQIGGRGALGFYYGEAGPPGPNEVHIAELGVVMPTGRILLVRKGQTYCALKFTQFWVGKTKDDLFAKYESYYQHDGAGDLSKKGIKKNDEKLSFPKPRGIGRFAFSFGNREVDCGAIKLKWSWW